MDQPKEMIFEILLNLNYPELMKFCQSNRSNYQLCQDEHFWFLKNQKDYQLTAEKPHGMSYQGQYRTLYALPPMEEAIRNNRVDQVLLLLRKGIKLTQKEVDLAAETGNLRLLNLFAEQGIFPDWRGYVNAARNEHLDVLDWLWNHKIEIPEEIISESRANSIPVLIWLKNHGVPLDEWTANSVTQNLKVLDWLESQGILPNVHGANLAAARGDWRFLEWMAKRGIYPNEEGIEEASAGHLDVIKWIVSLGVRPSVHAAGVAARYNQTDILDYYQSFGILPPPNSADNASDQGSVESLDWLATRGILPSQRGIYAAISNGRINVLQWLIDHGYQPTRGWALQAARANNQESLNWLADHGIYP